MLGVYGGEGERTNPTIGSVRPNVHTQIEDASTRLAPDDMTYSLQQLSSLMA